MIAFVWRRGGCIGGCRLLHLIGLVLLLWDLCGRRSLKGMRVADHVLERRMLFLVVTFQIWVFAQLIGGME